ncbi:hypothetical protein F4775DRAFT_202001 [Biscogniauxia sp. FL1348]|nr:hypothetical protein F4775DRAFT_202001 [Biscogniauxia sp. FL1348]
MGWIVDVRDGVASDHVAIDGIVVCLAFLGSRILRGLWLVNEREVPIYSQPRGMWLALALALTLALTSGCHFSSFALVMLPSFWSYIP